MRTFVISLKNSDRRFHMEQELKDYDFEFIDAVEGAKLLESEVNNINHKNYDYWLREYSRPLSRGEIGCSLSHHLIYRKMISDNIDWAIIFEDDIKLSGVNFQKLLRPEMLNEDDIYILGSQDGLNNRKLFLFSPFDSITLSNNIKLRKLIDSHHYVSRAASYVISKKVAEKILRFNDNFFSLADSWGIFKENSCFDRVYFTDIVKHPNINITPQQSLLEFERNMLEKKINKDIKKSLVSSFRNVLYRWGRSLRKRLSKILELIYF